MTMALYKIVAVLLVAVVPWMGLAFQPVIRSNAGLRLGRFRLFADAQLPDDMPQPSPSRRKIIVAAGSSALIGNNIGRVNGPTSYDSSSSVSASADKSGGKVLYKGADPSVLLLRLEDAGLRLIPSLAEKKEWSQIQGILSGLLGSMSQTLALIATPDSRSEVRRAANKLRTEILAIGKAASLKDGAACTARAQQASQYMNEFVKVVFQ